MISEGADIIDIGGFSSRPGAMPVSAEEELNRLMPALEILRDSYPDFPVSIDTCRSEVANELHVKYGIDIINDISGGNLDEKLVDFAIQNRLPYIIMHMQGAPENMQDNPVYEDIVDDLLDFFTGKIENYSSKGMNDIIIDPGFGFGKTLDHNFELLSALEVFRTFEIPILVGLSRKSMIYRSLGIDPGGSLNGSTALHMYALSKGASILRVHDVREGREVVQLYEKLNNAQKEH